MRLTQLPREQLVALKRAFHTARNPPEKLRYQAVLLAVKGFTRKQICEIIEKSPRSIGGWVAAYNKKGLEGLRSKRSPGNHRLLTNQQKAAIKHLTTTKKPSDLSLSGRFWTIPLLEQLVWQEFHLRYKDQDSYRRLLEFNHLLTLNKNPIY